MKKREEKPQPPSVEEELATLQEQVLALASDVEAVFADAVVALMENDSSAARDARVEDYKAHEAWLEADALSADLLNSGWLNLEQVHFVCASIKIALNLRQMADEGIRLSRHMSECSVSELPAPTRETLANMAEITESMFSDSVDAFVNRDATEAQSLNPVFHELGSLKNDLLEQVRTDLHERNVSAQAGVATALVARSLLNMGEHALDIANHVSHLYRAREEKPATDDAEE